MPGRKPYIVIKEVGQEQFEKVIEAHMDAGYVPIGGLSLFAAPGLVGTRPQVGYVQAMVDVEFGAPHVQGS